MDFVWWSVGLNIISISFDWFEFSFSKFQKNKFNMSHIDSRNLVVVAALSEFMANFLDLIAPFLEGEHKEHLFWCFQSVLLLYKPRQPGRSR